MYFAVVLISSKPLLLFQDVQDCPPSYLSLYIFSMYLKRQQKSVGLSSVIVLPLTTLGKGKRGVTWTK
jgi:hypothetical protein